MKNPYTDFTFNLGVYTWKVTFINLDHDNFGDTDFSLREIQVYTRNKNAMIIRSTLLHEVMHVTLENIIPTVVKIEDKPDVIEEQLILLQEPNLLEVFSKNKKLRNFVFGKD